MVSKSNERSRRIDISKGILILLVVLGHSGFPLTSYIYLFHMTAFVFFSGVTFNGKDLNIKEYTRKKIKGLYFPYVKIQIVFIIFHNFFVETKIIQDKNFGLYDYIHSLISALTFGGGGGELTGAMWFIPMLFFISIIYDSIYYLSNYLLYQKIKFHIIIFSIFLIGLFSVYLNINLPRHIDTAFLAMPFYHLGAQMKNIKEYVPRLSIFVLSVITLVIMSKFGSIDLGAHKITNPIFFVSASILGIYQVLYLANLINNIPGSDLFIIFGKNTFIIMAFHFFSFKIVNLLLLMINIASIDQISSFPTMSINNSIWLIYTLLGIIFPITLNIIHKEATNIMKFARVDNDKK